MTKPIHYNYISKIGGKISYLEQSDDENYHQHGSFALLYMIEHSVTAEIDGIATVIQSGDLIALSPLQHLFINQRTGEHESPARYALVLFDDRFYCIFGNDHEVSCRGQLFNGSSYVPHVSLSGDCRAEIQNLLSRIRTEFASREQFHEEALRSWLRLYIISATRATLVSDDEKIDKEANFELVRSFINLVDEHYRTHKQVKEYADMLHCSTKTLTNKVLLSGRGTPLKVIHERILSEAVRRLLYTNCRANELASYLGFTTPGHFSRFFRHEMNQSVRDYRKAHKRI